VSITEEVAGRDGEYVCLSVEGKTLNLLYILGQNFSIFYTEDCNYIEVFYVYHVQGVFFLFFYSSILSF